jgi:hypothetical protein
MKNDVAASRSAAGCVPFVMTRLSVRDTIRKGTGRYANGFRMVVAAGHRHRPDGTPGKAVWQLKFRAVQVSDRVCLTNLYRGSKFQRENQPINFDNFVKVCTGEEHDPADAYRLYGVATRGRGVTP